MLNLKRKPKRLILWVTVPFESLAGSETQGDGHTQAEGPARTGQVRGMRESRSSCEWPLALQGFGGASLSPKHLPTSTMSKQLAFTFGHRLQTHCKF